MGPAPVDDYVLTNANTCVHVQNCLEGGFRAVHARSDTLHTHRAEVQLLSERLDKLWQRRRINPPMLAEPTSDSLAEEESLLEQTRQMLTEHIAEVRLLRQHQTLFNASHCKCYERKLETFALESGYPLYVLYAARVLVKGAVSQPVTATR
eukprot:5015748-Amphidinium_carterae.1